LTHGIVPELQGRLGLGIHIKSGQNFLLETIAVKILENPLANKIFLTKGLR
jgi:hypothetical protein